MTQIAQYAVDALQQGAIYALMALGLALLFGVMDLMNIAYGEIIAIGGYTALALVDAPWPVMVAGVLVVAMAASLLMDLIVFRPTRRRGAGPDTLLVVSFALSVGIQQLISMTVGPRPQGLRLFPLFEKTITVAGVQITVLSIATVMIGLAVMAAMTWLVTRTRLGIYLRASTEDFEMAQMLGARPNRIIMAAFAVTGLLGGIVALLLVAQTGTVAPTMGVGPLLIALVGGVLGGLGSLTAAGAGGFVLGALTGVLEAALPMNLAPYTTAFAFGAVVLVLVLRPAGLLGSGVHRV